MKFKSLAAVLVIASTLTTFAQMGPVPTCDPANPDCTTDNGCNGLKCFVGGYSVHINTIETVSQLASHANLR